MEIKPSYTERYGDSEMCSVPGGLRFQRTSLDGLYYVSIDKLHMYLSSISVSPVIFLNEYILILFNFLLWKT